MSAVSSGAWQEIDLLSELTKSAFEKNGQGCLENFVIAYRIRAQQTVYFDSIIVEYTDESFEVKGAIGEKVFDFNGTDFDTTLEATGSFTEESSRATQVADTSSLLAGYSGGVYGASNAQYVGTAVDFHHLVDLSKVSSIKVRMYIPTYTVASGYPSLRLFQNETSDAVANATHPTLGGWCDVDILATLQGFADSNGCIERFVIGCRTKSSDGSAVAVYYDSIIIEYTDESYRVESAVGEMSIASVNNFTTNNGDWRFDFNMNGTWPTTEVEDRFNTNGMVVTIRRDDETVAELGSSDLTAMKVNAIWKLCIWGNYTNTHKPVAGDIVIISASQMTSVNDVNKIVNLVEETVLKYDGSNWNMLGDYVYTDYQDVTFNKLHSASAAQNGFWGIYPYPIGGGSSIPGTPWVTKFCNVEYMVNGISYQMDLQRANNSEAFYMKISEDIVSTTADGSMITIKAGKYSSNDGSDGIRITDDFTFFVVKGELKDSNIQNYAPNGTFADACEAFLLELGITADEIASIRQLLLV